MDTTKKFDLRIQKTYKLLTDAAMELLKEKDFNDITVRELCDKAMVRPATFYKHFGDKYEFFTFVIKGMVQEFHEKSKSLLDEEHPAQYEAAMVDQTLLFVEEHKQLITHTIQGSISHILLDLISEQVYLDAFTELRKGQDNNLNLSVEADRMAAILTGALSYTLKWWIMQDFKPERQVIVKDFEKLLTFEYSGM